MININWLKGSFAESTEGTGELDNGHKWNSSEEGQVLSRQGEVANVENEEEQIP